MAKKAGQKFNCKKLSIITLADSYTIEQDGLTIEIVAAAQWLMQK